MSAATPGKRQKPLLVIREPIKASVYRADFTPFAITRLLDANKVKQTPELSIEVGTLEAAGRSATLIARIERGMITRLTVRGCVGCDATWCVAIRIATTICVFCPGLGGTCI